MSDTARITQVPVETLVQPDEVTEPNLHQRITQVAVETLVRVDPVGGSAAVIANIGGTDEL